MRKNLLKIVLISFILPGFTLAQIIDCPYFSPDRKTLINYPQEATGTLVEIATALFKNITHFVIQCLVKPALILVIIISGIYIMTSSGNPGELEKGKKALTAAIIGLIIIFVAEAIVDFFKKYL